MKPKYIIIILSLLLAGAIFFIVYDKRNRKDVATAKPKSDSKNNDNHDDCNCKKFTKGFVLVDNTLFKDGELYTGLYKGENYKNGKITDAIFEYETNGERLLRNGEPFTGIRHAKKYKDGLLVKEYEFGTDKLLRKNGELYTGFYAGGNYKDGKLTTVIQKP